MSAPKLFLSVVIATFLLQLFLPWWIVVPIGLTAGWFSRTSALQTAGIVFISVGLVWLLMSLYLSFTTSTVLLPRMAEMFQLPSVWMVFVVTVLVGAVPATLAAYGGAKLRVS